MRSSAMCACLLLLPGAAAAAGPATPRGHPAVSAERASIGKPDLRLEGFPVWLGEDRRLDRVAVLVEGFDLYNQIGPEELLLLAGPVVKSLAAAGLDLLVVDFPDSHLAPDALAPEVARAVRAAAAAAGAPVAVVGLSAGGLSARWALAAAEESGAPLPVHTLVCFDTPHRGANLSPELQAIVSRYGKRRDREAIESPAARALLTACPGAVRWRRVGLPGMRRRVPVRCEADRSGSEAFFSRLKQLNGGGYPRQCRVVSVAQGSRRDARGAACSDPPECGLFRLWLPLGCGWTAPAAPADVAQGSRLPKAFAARLQMRLPLGVAGSGLRTTPTFVSTESALDAAPGETPPVHAWYARPDGLPPIDHDALDPGVAEFMVRVLTAAG